MIFKTWPWLSITSKNNMKKKSVVWWEEIIINTSYKFFIEHSANCGRLWVVEVSCQGQVNFLTKGITFLIWNCHFFPLILSTSRHCRHSVQKAVDLITPGKNRDKMSGKKWHFQIIKVITLVRKLTWTWQLTSTTHSLRQCALISLLLLFWLVLGILEVVCLRIPLP